MDLETVELGDGLVRLRLNEHVFPLIMISRRRAELCCDHPLLAYSNIFVHESEYDEYQRVFDAAERHPLAVLTHKTHSCSRIRQYIMDTYFRPGEESYHLHVDDDYSFIQYIMSFRSHKITDPLEVLALWSHVGRCAIDAGAGLFFMGGSMKSPRERVSWNPFALRRWANGGFFGWIDPAVRMDLNLLACEDIDHCLYGLVLHKINWIDMRFIVNYKDTAGLTRNDKGGDAGLVTWEIIQREQRYLVWKWGESVVKLNAASFRRGQGYAIAISAPSTHAASRPLLEAAIARGQLLGLSDGGGDG